MKTVKLGELIEIYEIRNSENKQYEFLGINKDKVFMPSVANTDFVDARKYKIIKKDMFVFSGMQTGRDMCIRIGLYTDEIPGLLSPAYTTFVVKDKTQILPEYLFLLFNRTEMDRFGAYLSDGSVRANLDWEIFIDIEIPLPDLETQKQIVASYNGLKNVIDDNMALVEPLEKTYQAFLSDCQKRYSYTKIGNYVEPVTTINSSISCDFLRGVGNTGFIEPRQERTYESLKKCTIFYKGDIVYNPSVLFNGAIAINQDYENAICTEEYVVFHSKDKTKLLPEFVYMWLKRKEMGRYFWFSNMDSVRNRIYYEDMCEVLIPLPPIEVQQSIVNIFNCAQEAKKIANEAKEELKKLCPALVQFASKSA